jgi:hypothetical protein
MTANGTHVFIRLNGRDVMLERTGDEEGERYILTWGMEGKHHPAGMEGLMAVIHPVNLAVEQVMNYPPPEKGKQKRIEMVHLFDRSERAEKLRMNASRLIKDILTAQEQKRVATYRGKS